jgi:hypothetical protein
MPGRAAGASHGTGWPIGLAVHFGGTVLC